MWMVAYVSCMYALCTCLVPEKSRRKKTLDFLGGVPDACWVLPFRCWELNPGPVRAASGLHGWAISLDPIWWVLINECIDLCYHQHNWNNVYFHSKISSYAISKSYNEYLSLWISSAFPECYINGTTIL